MRGRDVGIGIALASVVLFTVEMAPMLRDVSLRHPLEPSGVTGSVFEDFVALSLGFAAMGITIWWTAELLKDPSGVLQ